MIAGYAPFAQRRARQTGVGLLVVGLHLAGLLAWWTQGYEMRLAQKPAEIASIAVWLPQLSTPFTEREKKLDRKLTAAPERPQSDARALHSATAATQTQARDDAAVHVPLAQGSVALAPTAPASALDLTLTRKALSALVQPGFAEKAQFHKRLPATVEQQVASAFIDRGPWTEERIDLNHIRLRRGNTCIVMERPEAAQLFSFEDSAQRSPWRANQPTTCQ